MSSDFCCDFDMALFVARYLFRNFGWNAIDIEKLENCVSLGGIPIVTWICWVHRSFQPCSAVALDFD